MNRKEFLKAMGVVGVTSMLSPFAAGAEALAAEQKSKKGAAAASDQPQKIKIGIIGCGSVSTQYLPLLSTSPYCELVSCCDIKPQRAQRAAEQYNIPKHYAHIDDMLAGDKFDLLVNTTNMQVHGELNRKALNANCNVWSEKPMANTYAEGKELYDMANSKGLRIWGAPAVVNSPQFSFMAQQIKEGKLGRVAGAHGHYGHEGPGWSAFFYEELGGSLPDLGVYNISTLTGLLGPVKSVVARLNIITPNRTVDDKGHVRVQAEDNAMIIMEHESGALSHIQSGFNYFDPYGHHGKGQEKPTVSIWGSHGNMHLMGYDWMPLGVDMATFDHPETQRFQEDAEGFLWQEGATSVAESMVKGTEPRINAEHALHVLEIIEAARASEKTGKRIDLVSKFPWPMV